MPIVLLTLMGSPILYSPLQDVIDGNVFFLFKNEANLTDAGGNPIGPDFTITVADDDGASVTEVGNVLNFTDKNDLPVLNDFIDSDAVTDGVQFEFELKEGTPQPLNAGDIDATDEETSASNLVYTVTDINGGNVTGGTFFVAGVETNTFTQAQLNAGNLVFFVDDGTFTGAAGDSLPAFKLTVDDGEGGVVETTLTATFTDVVASAPVITTNTFNITEESQFQVTTAILDAEDIDTVDADLTFTITGDASTAFLVDAGAGPVPNTTFTREDLLNNKVFFNYEGEDTPEFTITVSDGDAASADATAAGNVRDYDPVNDTPTLAINVGGVTLNEGGSFFITDTIFTFTDAEFDATPSLQDAEQIIYTYTATNGFFADAAGSQINNFTHADVLAGNVVQFIQDGTPAAPSFTVTVADNGFTLSDGRAFPTSESATATVLTTDFGAFNATNDAPTIELNQFSVVEGQPLTINTSVLQIKDEETLNSANLTIEITSAAANSAEVLAAFSQTTFTYQDVVLGNVTFTYDGEVEPEFEITVTDDGRLTPAGAPTAATESTTVAANILNFQNTNDAPVFVDQDGGTPGIQLGAIAVTEDSFVAITTAIISATDVDLPVGADLTYTVSNVVGGNFTLNGIEAANITTTFTQNDIESGLVFFVNNGENTDEVPVGVRLIPSAMTFKSVTMTRPTLRPLVVLAPLPQLMMRHQTWSTILL
ncbi:MAG: hypothetical protein F6K00_09895 [Leptolyngbya sp. SIOISBB]|nr:hypothetical protein [Leptolyngbya sp. SIOISBB]